MCKLLTIVDDLHVFTTASVSEHDPPLLWYLDGIPQAIGKGTAALSIPDECEIDPVVAFNPLRNDLLALLPADLPAAQGQSAARGCDPLARRANQQKAVQPLHKKYSASAQPKSTP